MKIGITGATGQLGRLVVENLKKKGLSQNLVALVRSTSKAQDLGIEARTFDYNQPASSLQEALKGIDRLLLISGSDLGQRAKQHSNVIEAATKAGISRIVYTSILHADTSSLSLAVEHMATEKAIKASNITYTILRNGWYFENYAGSIKGALMSGAIIGSAGNGKISPATRADFAEAAAIVITEDGHKDKTYELAGDEAYSLTDLASEVSQQTGKQIPYNNLPETEYASILKSFGLPEEISKAIASWDIGASKGDLMDNSHQLSTLIGRPTTPFTQSVKAALAEMG